MSWFLSLETGTALVLAKVCVDLDVKDKTSPKPVITSHELWTEEKAKLVLEKKAFLIGTLMGKRHCC